MNLWEHSTADWIGIFVAGVVVFALAVVVVMVYDLVRDIKRRTR